MPEESVIDLVVPISWALNNEKPAEVNAELWKRVEDAIEDSKELNGPLVDANADEYLALKLLCEFCYPPFCC